MMTAKKTNADDHLHIRVTGSEKAAWAEAAKAAGITVSQWVRQTLNLKSNHQKR